MPSFFITGTDTGVGKTALTCWLIRGWLANGSAAAGLKPISTGNREDAIRIRNAMEFRLELDEINPVHFGEPAAPLVAARAENRTIDFARVDQIIRDVGGRFSHVAIEGIGGWRVPLAPDYGVREWARDLGLPVVVVARGTLGTLNHTLLTVGSIREAGLTCAGVVVYSGADESGPQALPDLDLIRRRNVALLRELLALPVFELDRGAQTSGHVPVWLGGK
jgi:dethiobiotin synthetase